jgi:hypothetical protein
MARYAMVVQSRPREGREADYNAWYDEVHLADVAALPGVVSGRRFEFAGGMVGEPGQPYLAIYEIETEDMQAFVAELGRRLTDGTMRQTDAMDGSASVVWFYKAR